MSENNTPATSTIPLVGEVERPRSHRRHSSFDENTRRSLEKQLANRPEKSELVERNILKDDRVAPSLQAAREQLEKHQLQDKMGQALLHRPKPEDLVKEGILLPEEVPAQI
ncbi:rpel repeat protein [Pyrrhoderma noxium]|uniref:Rpel repeat protein n=1 Tax=Pyrrhoderma noxium TaxID=2282107 RepID=A0A286UGL5_9AGAM|nr:rpel repeat protein [Pyrrhoderma noxium]